MRAAASKQWIHPPDTLLRGHILYNVKFLGECEVDAPKGTDVVRDAIRKRKFNKHIKKAEGRKTPKVELSISADGVIVQEPKSKFVLHQYPLHRISYCADDKADKRMFTFIAKAADTSQHFCYVFASDKCAEEITLTIGQAFDLAYRRFLDTQGKDMDAKKQHVMLQKRIQTLEKENKELKQRIQTLEQMKDRDDIEEYKQANGISDLTSIAVGTVVMLSNVGESTTDSPNSSQPGTPKNSGAGRRLENLVFDERQPQTNGVGTSANQNGSFTSTTPGILSPPPPSTRSRNSPRSTSLTSTPSQDESRHADDDLATVFNSQPVQQQEYSTTSFNPFTSTARDENTAPGSDPFGMGTFQPAKPPASNTLDQDFLDLQAGFNQGISFGTEDFQMDDFDPLNQSK